jgi:transketolase
MSVNAQEMSNAIRALSMDAVEKANSGHPGMPMGMADVATVLFAEFLKFNPSDPTWADRDRFILSAGHGSMLLYSLLYLTGYEEMTLDEIKNFRQLGAKTCGHPEFGLAGGIETTTGPLGQGLANSVGFALAEKMLNARFGELVDHKTYVIAGDGCLMEGISQEAISLAGHLKLNKLIVLWDDNKISIDGPTSLATSEDQLKRFEASGWNVSSIDGHNFDEIRNALSSAQNSDKPVLIACRTTIAKGAPTKAGTSGSHGSPLGKTEIEGARKILNWNHEPFVIPSAILNAWREVGTKNIKTYNSWKNRLRLSEFKKEFERVVAHKLPVNLNEEIQKAKKVFSASSKMATRKSSGESLKTLAAVMPELIGGSADLTGSNLTKNDLKPITANDYSGRYIYYGVREHAMCAAMNGISLHGGFRPYGGTFFVFTDYCKPSIRLAALMHQPVEHLASMRAIPNLLVLRPADATETLECWQIALENLHGPSMLVLTRQDVPNIRPQYTEENLCSKGAYLLKQHENPDITLLATGSEIGLALDAEKKLSTEGVKANVVSFPSWELFEKQKKKYKKQILGNASHPKIAIEAGSKFGWERYIGTKGGFIGMHSFGASAPAEKLYEHFGITVAAIVTKAKELVK